MTDDLPRYPITINAFEAGVLIVFIGNKPPAEQLRFKGLLNELCALEQKFRDEAEVTITDLGNGIINLQDRNNNKVIRHKYPWEL